MQGRRITTAALAVCLALGGLGTPLATQAYAATADVAKKAKGMKATQAPDYEWKLTRVGTFKGNAFSVNAVYADHGAISEEVEFEPEYTVKRVGLIGPDGKSLTGGQAIEGADYLGNGIFIARIDNDEVNCVGLVNEEGEVLIPFEAADIRTATYNKEDARFLEVVYAEGETSNDGEAVYDGGIDPLRSFGTASEKEKKAYKGYREVFSLETGKMVKGVRITDPSSTAFDDLHDSFAVTEGGTTTLYDAKGKKLWEGKKDAISGVWEYGILHSDKNGGRSIINPAGDVSYEAEKGAEVSWIWESDGLFEVKDGDKWTVIDIDGNQVLEGAYDQVNSARDGLFDVGNGSDRRVVDPSGDTVMKSNSDNLRHNSGILMLKVSGYVLTKAKDENVLFKSGEKLATSEESEASLLIFADGDDYLVLNDEEYSLTLAEAHWVDVGLVEGKTSKKSESYGLYDLFTGEELIEEGKYSSFTAAGGYIYAYKGTAEDGTWTVYKAEIEEV